MQWTPKTWALTCPLAGQLRELFLGEHPGTLCSCFPKRAEPCALSQRPLAMSSNSPQLPAVPRACPRGLGKGLPSLGVLLSLRQ